MCSQTVTIYHVRYGNKGEFACDQWVLQRVFFDSTLNRATDQSGSRLTSGFLLVIPNQSPLPLWKDGLAFDTMEPEQRQGWYTLQPGDKVVLGKGPMVETRGQWAEMVHEKMDNLAIVRCVNVKRLGNKICHVEFEGWRSYSPRKSR